ncbi:hypothetical protein IV203_026014 [Nitzschia inconspicua]|uniref:G-protein coupled receptors family 2 profile 2 domain-containing protein n=1 Tax=Nitzschia inconspicua TaxID=303405 RepID=A0A9K3PZG5_9STRA|nr:hypothetical protein IV203_026014 [Nitzschia inconspicua]
MVLNFSYAKRVTLAVTPKVSGFLSICGSSWIIVEVLTEQTKRKTVYNRLLLWMSIMDATVAITYVFSTWPIPTDSPTVVWAAGNTATCNAQGFFNQLGIISPIYNVCLAFYYILVVKNGVTENQLRKYAEPLMHLSAMGFGVVTAAISLKLTLFNNADVWCWIAPLPFDCKESHRFGETNCIRGDNAFVYRWAFFYAPLWFCMFTVLVLNGIMYFHVKSGEQDARQREASHFAMHGNRTAREILAGHPNTGQQNVTSVRLNNPRHRRATMLNGEMVKRPSFFGYDPFASEENHGGDSNDNTISSFSMVLPEMMIEKLRARGLLFRGIGGDSSQQYTSVSIVQDDTKHCSTNSDDIRHVLEVIEEYPSAAKQYSASYQFGSRVVLSQCLAYTVSFFLAWTFSSINRVVQNETDTNFFGLLLCQSIFEPLQGLFNVLVYRYAFYLRLKTRNLHLSRWNLFVSTWRWTYLGPPPGVQESLSLKVFPAKGRPFSTRNIDSAALSPSTTRPFLTNPSQIRGSSCVKDQPLDSTRDSAIGDAVNILADESFNAPKEHGSSLMVDLMMDYFDNPSLLNQNMVAIQTDVPFYISEDDDDDDDDVPTPAYYPMQVSPASQYPVITTMSDCLIMSPLDDTLPVEPNEDVHKSDQEEQEEEPIAWNGDFRVPSGRSETLVSISSD